MARHASAGHAALRASEHGTFDHEAFEEDHPWEIAAVDADGDELYRTEHFESRADAQATCDEFDEGEANWTKRIDDEVDHFEPRKK